MFSFCSFVSTFALSAIAFRPASDSSEDVAVPQREIQIVAEDDSQGVAETIRDAVAANEQFKGLGVVITIRGLEVEVRGDVPSESVRNLLYETVRVVDTIELNKQVTVRESVHEPRPPELDSNSRAMASVSDCADIPCCSAARERSSCSGGYVVGMPCSRCCPSVARPASPCLRILRRRCVRQSGVVYHSGYVCPIEDAVNATVSAATMNKPVASALPARSQLSIEAIARASVAAEWNSGIEPRPGRRVGDRIRLTRLHVKAPLSFDNRPLAMEFYGVGCHSFWSRQYAESLQQFDRAIELFSDDARFWYFKGLAESATGDANAAERSLGRAVGLHIAGKPANSLVGQALIRVQGIPRLQLELARQKATLHNRRAPESPSLSDDQVARH